MNRILGFVKRKCILFFGDIRNPSIVMLICLISSADLHHINMPLNERLRRPRILLKRAFQLHRRRNILSEPSTCYLETSARVLEIKVQALVNYAARKCENISELVFYRGCYFEQFSTIFH